MEAGFVLDRILNELGARDADGVEGDVIVAGVTREGWRIGNSSQIGTMGSVMESQNGEVEESPRKKRARTGVSARMRHRPFGIILARE
jgi:hypothetical protein